MLLSTPEIKIKFKCISKWDKQENLSDINFRISQPQPNNSPLAPKNLLVSHKYTDKTHISLKLLESNKNYFFFFFPP